MTHPMALFHREMFHLTQSNLKFLGVMAFRASGKSTILNTSNVLYSVLGKPQKHFPLLISKTHNQAKAHFMNMRRELETNRLLASDLGPFDADEGDFGMHSLTLKRPDAKIMMVSREQSVRGLRHGPYRPDLIILDDIEDSSSIENKDESARTYHWYQNEILTSAAENANVVIIGNLLHEKSFLMRIRNDIRSGRLPGEFRAYPLLDDKNKILWPSRFPDRAAIATLRKSVPDDIWKTEYLLQLNGGCEVRKYYPFEFQPYGKDAAKALRLAQQKRWDKKASPCRTLGKYRISAPMAIYGDICWEQFFKQPWEWSRYVHSTIVMPDGRELKADELTDEELARIWAERNREKRFSEPKEKDDADYP